VERQGNPEDWDEFYALLGRYATSAGNAESMMYRIIEAMRSRAKLPSLVKVPMWAGWVDALRKEAAGTPYEERVTILLGSAPRRGILRNNLVHAGWFSASPDGYIARRHPANGSGSSMMFLQRDVLEATLKVMEWFENELERLALDVALGR